MSVNIILGEAYVIRGLLYSQVLEGGTHAIQGVMWGKAEGTGLTKEVRNCKRLCTHGQVP